MMIGPEDLAQPNLDRAEKLLDVARAVADKGARLRLEDLGGDLGGARQEQPRGTFARAQTSTRARSDSTVRW